MHFTMNHHIIIQTIINEGFFRHFLLTFLGFHDKCIKFECTVWHEGCIFGCNSVTYCYFDSSNVQITSLRQSSSK